MEPETSFPTNNRLSVERDGGKRICTKRQRKLCRVSFPCCKESQEGRIVMMRKNAVNESNRPAILKDLFLFILPSPLRQSKINL